MDDRGTDQPGVQDFLTAGVVPLLVFVLIMLLNLIIPHEPFVDYAVVLPLALGWAGMLTWTWGRAVAGGLLAGGVMLAAVPLGRYGANLLSAYPLLVRGTHVVIVGVLGALLGGAISDVLFPSKRRCARLCMLAGALVGGIGGYGGGLAVYKAAVVAIAGLGFLAHLSGSRRRRPPSSSD